MPCCPCIIIIGGATRAPIDDTGSYTTHLSAKVIQRLAQSSSKGLGLGITANWRAIYVTIHPRLSTLKLWVF
jgi:hypothetical protein